MNRGFDFAGKSIKRNICQFADSFCVKIEEFFKNPKRLPQMKNEDEVTAMQKRTLELTTFAVNKTTKLLFELDWKSLLVG
jgi:hypothetical protein